MNNSNTQLSLRQLIHQCNNIPFSLLDWIHSLNSPLQLNPLDSTSIGYAFLIVNHIHVGIIIPEVAIALLEHPNVFHRVSIYEIAMYEPPPPTNTNTNTNSNNNTIVQHNEIIRSQWIANILSQWRTSNRFPALSGWRNELYPVYGNDGCILCCIERAASGLFGIRTYGCHLTAYTLPDGANHPHPSLQLWLARRSLTKPTFPGMLDNTAAGGLPVGQTPIDCIIRECSEEATISTDYARNNIQPAGAISYYQKQAHIPSLGGIAGPETQYVFDLKVSQQFTPTINDDEVLGFIKVSHKEALQLLTSGQFKPNCAIVLIDFLIRHGYITSQNEPDYLELIHGCHRPLEWYFPGPRWINSPPSTITTTTTTCSNISE